MHEYIHDETTSASKEGRPTPSFTVTNFNIWACSKLRSPRAVWLYTECFSFGSMLVVLRAAIRCDQLHIFQRIFFYCKSFRVNNVPVAKGCLHALRGLAWSNHLPYYRDAILRSRISEEIQVKLDLYAASFMNDFGI